MPHVAAGDSSAHLANPLGDVVALHIAAGSGDPMQAVDEIRVEAGVGIIGDRYHGSRHRHVSVQSAEELAEAAIALGRPIDPGSTRRTVTLASGRLPTAPGTRLAIGAVTLEIVWIAAPCAVMEEQVGRGARAALRRRAGVICRALSSGRLCVGDAAVSPPG